MSIENAETVAVSETAPAKITLKPKTTKPKPVKKPTPPKKSKDESRQRAVGNTELTVEQRREKLIKVMSKCGATNAASSKTADELAVKSGFTRFDVYGLLYHTNKLAVDGYIKQVKMEEVKGLSYYLTAKGVKGYSAS